jgi:tetratricopeptide (TPR) repeat protein
MHLPVSAFPVQARMEFARAGAAVLLCLLASAGPSARVVAAQGQLVNATSRERMHESDQWAQIEPHLPDPKTATAQTLEMQADILRARRFPDDAMDYYRYAIARGGNEPNLLNKLGLAELEMGNVQLGRVYFQRAVKLDRKNPDAWNNLGASEFIDGRQLAALQDYKKAVKLNKHKAVFHANLANADFETKDFHGARREIAAALELDPQVFELQGTGGVAAHVLSSRDLAQFSLEMAKMYARSGMTEKMLHALSKAAESGMDVQIEMRKDPALAGYENDPRVVVLVHNAQLLRAGRPAAVSAAGSDGPGGVKPL